LVIDLTDDSEDTLDPSTVVNIFGSGIKIPKKRVLLSRRDLDEVAENVKTELSRSELIRIVDNPFREGKREELDKAIAEDELDLILFVRYPLNDSFKEIYFQLTEADSGYSIHFIEAKAKTYDEAIRKALSDLEEKLFKLPWRCKVIAIKDKGMIINRGYLDGLHEGIKLVGYSIKPNKDQTNFEPEELILMKYGKKEGLFRVIEVKRHYSIVEPDSDEDMLAPNDILELPEIRFEDRDIKSRGSQTWDKIFQE
jgi:hypothetical protein